MRGALLLLFAVGAVPLSAGVWAHAPVQGEHGRAVYVAHCAGCHGQALEGVDEMPALVGMRFEAKWRGHEAALAAKIRLSMPQDNPGSLTPTDAADVAALVLAANHLPTPTPMRSR